MEVKYEELNTGHSYPHGKPAEIVQWLLTELGVTEFEDAESDPSDHGESMKFDQEEIVNTLGDVEWDDTDMKDWGKIYVPDSCIDE